MTRLEQFRQRVAVHYHIDPLDEVETKQYILFRLNYAKANGRDLGKLFESETFDPIYRYSRGLPRMINKLCDHALFIGFVSDRETINSKIIEEAIEELRFREERKHEQIFQST